MLHSVCTVRPHYDWLQLRRDSNSTVAQLVAYLTHEIARKLRRSLRKHTTQGRLIVQGLRDTQHIYVYNVVDHPAESTERLC